MAKKAYIGIKNVARKIKQLPIGVGGVARKVKAGYVGVAGVARQWFAQSPIFYITNLTARDESTGTDVYAKFTLKNGGTTWKDAYEGGIVFLNQELFEDGTDFVVGSSNYFAWGTVYQPQADGSILATNDSQIYTHSSNAGNYVYYTDTIIDQGEYYVV